MGEKGNVVGGHVPAATQAAHTGAGLGGQALSSQAPQASGGGGGGGGLLSDLVDKAGDKITDVGIGRGASGVVEHSEEEDEEA